MTLLDTLVDGLSQERIRIRSRQIHTAYCTVVCSLYSVLRPGLTPQRRRCEMSKQTTAK